VLGPGIRAMERGAQCRAHHATVARYAHSYQGINVLMLWSAASRKGYAAPIWMTFKQAIELKACVRKGEHGSLVVMPTRSSAPRRPTAVRETERAIPFMKGYTVFMSSRSTDCRAFYGKPERGRILQRIAHAEAFFAATGRNVRSRRQSGLFVLDR